MFNYYIQDCKKKKKSEAEEKTEKIIVDKTNMENQ